MQTTRREMLARSLRTFGVVAGAGLIGAACDSDTSGDSDAARAQGSTDRVTDTTDRVTDTSDATSDATREQAVSVELGDYPLWQNDAIVADPASLDALAQAYVARIGNEKPDVPRFLFGDVAIQGFDGIFASSAPAPTSTMWLFWVSGYFGGVWLRSEIDRAQPGTSTIANIKTTPTREAFLAIADTAAGALTAIERGEVLDYCDRALLPQGRTGGFVDGLVENFGYNQGYMLQILERPPEGLDTGAQYGITCAATLECTYAAPKLASLPSLVRRAQGPAYHGRLRSFADVEDAAVQRGRAVWSGGLSVQGFTQQAYDQLLDVSSSYLETVHATTLACLVAVVERDDALASLAAVANASMNVWLAGYQTGLLAGLPYRAPRFVNV